MWRSARLKVRSITFAFDSLVTCPDVGLLVVRISIRQSNVIDARASWLLHGRFTEAEADYSRLVALYPQEQLLWFYKGYLLAYLGETDRHREHCRAMLDWSIRVGLLQRNGPGYSTRTAPMTKGSTINATRKPL